MTKDWEYVPWLLLTEYRYGTGKTSNYATYELQRDNTYSVYGEDKQLSLAQEKLYDYYQYQLAFNAGFSYDRILENTKSMPMPAIISLNYLYRVTIPLMRVKESMAN